MSEQSLHQGLVPYVFFQFQFRYSIILLKGAGTGSGLNIYKSRLKVRFPMYKLVLSGSKINFFLNLYFSNNRLNVYKMVYCVAIADSNLFRNGNAGIHATTRLLHEINLMEDILISVTCSTLVMQQH